MLHPRTVLGAGRTQRGGVINYDGRRFRADDGGETAAIAQYHQRGDLLWAEFDGGEVRRGSLCGRAAPEGELEFAYSIVLLNGEVVSGRCHSTPELLADGRVRLHERWQRFGANPSAGVSTIEEI